MRYYSFALQRALAFAPSQEVASFIAFYLGLFHKTLLLSEKKHVWDVGSWICFVTIEAKSKSNASTVALFSGASKSTGPTTPHPWASKKTISIIWLLMTSLPSTLLISLCERFQIISEARPRPFHNSSHRRCRPPPPLSTFAGNCIYFTLLWHWSLFCTEVCVSRRAIISPRWVKCIYTGGKSGRSVQDLIDGEKALLGCHTTQTQPLFWDASRKIKVNQGKSR